MRVIFEVPDEDTQDFVDTWKGVIERHLHDTVRWPVGTSFEIETVVEGFLV